MMGQNRAALAQVHQTPALQTPSASNANLLRYCKCIVDLDDRMSGRRRLATQTGQLPPRNPALQQAPDSPPGNPLSCLGPEAVDAIQSAESARLHDVARRCGGVAVRSTSAAAGIAGGRISQRRRADSVSNYGIATRFDQPGLFGGPQFHF